MRLEPFPSLAAHGFGDSKVRDLRGFTTQHHSRGLSRNARASVGGVEDEGEREGGRKGRGEVEEMREVMREREEERNGMREREGKRKRRKRLGMDINPGVGTEAAIRAEWQNCIIAWRRRRKMKMKRKRGICKNDFKGEMK